MANFPQPDIAAALAGPTVQTTDPKTGYVFDATSPVWKVACAPLPSFSALQWPGYATTSISDVINGVEVVIQPWLGLCEQFFGRTNFPGGVGGEVGVYVRVDGGRPPPDLAILPGIARPAFQLVEALGGDRLWWPDADMQPSIEFSIINPFANNELLHTGPESTYWLNKWIEPSSYDKYKASSGGKLPPSPTQYKMVFTVAGKTRTWMGGQVYSGAT